MRSSPLGAPWPALVFAVLCAGCKAGPMEPLRDPDEAAPAKNAALIEAADKSGDAPVRRKGSALAYVGSEVITYRDVLLRIGPQLAVLADENRRGSLERETVRQLMRERIVFQAAKQAGMVIRRQEIEHERANRVRELKDSGGTLDAYLAERGMTRREYDENIRREIAIQKYLLAAIGGGRDPGVKVRQMADAWVRPEDVRAFYDRHPERFHEPASASMRMLRLKANIESDTRPAALAKVKAKAHRALGRLRAGEDWVPVYRELTRGAENPDPLDGLVTIVEGDEEKADWIVEFAFGSKKGAVRVVEKGLSVYVLYAEGAKPARQVPFDDVRSSLRRELEAARRRAAAYEVELKLLADSTVWPQDAYLDVRESLRTQRRKVMQEYDL